MPIPIIVGVAAAAAAAYGAKKGYDGYQKHSEADEIVDSAKSKYDDKKSLFDAHEKETTAALELLGNKELEIGQGFSEFKTIADNLLKQLNSSNSADLELKIPKVELQKIDNYTYTAIGVLGTVAGAGAAGAAAGFAIYGGVMTLGVASTGTAIGTLSGVAATNATLAAIGGGSLASGGLGIAGGTAILGVAVAAPVLAIAGWAYNSHGEEAVKNAKKVSMEVDEAIKKLSKAISNLERTEQYVREIRQTLMSIYSKFQVYFKDLKDINDIIEISASRGLAVQDELARFGDEIIIAIENGFAIASILVDIITTPIFKVKKVNNEVQLDDNGVPVLLVDADGSMVLNSEGIEGALISGTSQAATFN